MLGNKTFTFDRVIRIALTVIVIWGIIWILGYLSDVLIPFVVAMLLAYLINPLVRFFQYKVRVRLRVLSVIISLIIVFGFFILLCWFLLPAIGKEISHMGGLIKTVATDINIQDHSSEYFPEGIATYIQDFVKSEEVQKYFDSENFAKLAVDSVQKILPGIWGFFSGAINIVIGIFGFAIIIIYLIFILIFYDNVMAGAKELIPDDYRTQILEVIEDFKTGMSTYFRAQALIASTVGILFAIGFKIIGLPMGIVFGLFVGLLNMVPYLQIVGYIPATFLVLLYSLETGDNFWMMMGFTAIVFAVVQLIQEILLVPHIMGKAMKISPAVILLSLTIWGKLLGLLGLLIALPVTYLIYSYYLRFLRKRVSEKLE